MAVYGQYETVAELGRTGITSVWRARPADGGWDLGFSDLGTDSNFALKAFHVRRAEDAGGGEHNRFLERVRSQQRVADISGVTHWAPIITAGVVRDEAYYVTRYYPRTAARIAADADHPLDAASLHAIVSGILQGLVELRRTQGRPHGNVKATNVLIASAAGPVAPGDVALTDPAVEQDATIAGEVEDLYNLGEVIHALVLHAKFNGQHTWPVPMSPEWAALGKRGDRWLGLCNHLLSPRAAENWLRVDDILDEVAALRPPRKRFRSKKLWAAVAAIALIAGAGVFEHQRHTAQWRDLCHAYDDWLGPLEASLAKATPREIASDPYLQDQVVRPLVGARAGEVDLDPRRIAGSDQPLPVLAERPPWNVGAVWETEKAWRVARGVEQSLGPAKWQALADVRARQDRYDKLGWPKLAKYASAITDVARREPGKGWAAGIAAVVDGRQRLDRLDNARDAARNRLNGLVKQAEGAAVIRDRIGEFEAALRGSTDADLLVPTAAAADSLARQLTESEQLAARFEGVLPLVADAAKRQRAYEYRGWPGPAKYLGSLVERARPGGEMTGLAEALAAARRDWEQAEAQWAKIEQRRRVLETSGDRILGTYRNYVAAVGPGEAADLAALARKLAEVNDDPSWAAAARKVEEPEWAKIDVVDFAQKSDAHRGFAGRTIADARDLRKWLTEVEGYGSQLASASMKPDAGNGDVTTKPKSPTTLASATSAPTETTRPSPTTLASVAPAPTTTESTKPSPTTLASVPPPPTTTESTKPSPTTLASADPPAATQRVNTAIAMVPQPTPRETLPPAATTRESVQPPTTIATVPQPVTKPVVPQPTPDELRMRAEIAAFISECREVGINVANADVKGAWRARNDQIAASVEKNPKLYTPALKAEREKLRGRLLQLDSAYKTAGAPLALKPAPGAPAWNPPLVKSLQEAAPQWSATLAELIGLASAGDAKFDAALAGLIEADEQSRAAAGRLVADADRVARLLDAGYGPGDTAADGAPVATALAALRTADLYVKNPAVQQALEPLLRPVSVVETERGATALRLLAESTDQPLGVRLAAWAKTGTGQVSAESLESDLKLAGTLLTSAQSKSPDKSRADSVKARLEADVRARWEALMDNAARDADVAAAIALRERITGIDAQRLSAKSKYNFALHDLRAAVAAAPAGDDAPRQIAPAAERLRKAAAALDPAQAKQASVAALAAELARAGQGGAIDFTKLGPLSDAAQRASGGKIAWSAAAAGEGDEAGDQVTYRASIVTDLGKDDVTLVFRRVRIGGSSRSSWVCTGETSLGIFANLLSAAGRWPEVREGKLLTPYDPARPDPRVGPRVWEWPRYGRSQDVTWARVWLSVPGFIPDRLEHYPASIASDLNPTQIADPRSRDRERSPELNPSRRQPMQYVSPGAAALAASIAGCRLPSVAEWQAAHKSVEQHVGVNVRDRTWRAQLEHLAKLQGVGGRLRPDAGMFVPAGEQPSDKVAESPIGGELYDGVLWFREPPTAPPVFVDLVGNVAEYVTDEAGKLYVIGGSALSPPTRPVDKPFAVAPDQATGGFSDVGFRMAFGEPAQGIEKLREAVAGNWYLK